MATLSIDIPASAVTRVTDAFVSVYGYRAALDGTVTEFTRQQIIKFIKDTVRQYESAAANASLISNVNAIAIA